MKMSFSTRLRRLGVIFGALVYDLLLVAAIAFFVAIVAVLINRGEPVTSTHDYVLAFYAGLVVAIVGYFIYSWRVGGQTLGMRAWRLVLRSRHNTRLDLISCLGRAGLVSLASFGPVYAVSRIHDDPRVYFAFCGFHFLWILVNPRAATFADWILKSKIESTR